ncbi:glycosyltransferase family 4 protein [Luteimonas sp. MJ174]|uniref:glycosyltransferase family 4 protein n=1 Tax=Luteimonas sp. MJ174 TaxID=3129237 RepID=UPI0031BB8806
MRIAFLCKRRYMGKDVIGDRYARLYEIPFQLARLGHEVRGFCFSYQGHDDGKWTHDAGPGSLSWQSRSGGRLYLPTLVAYPWHMLRQLRAFAPDIVIGASDIPHVALGAWLARRLQRPFMADLYDNFEGFGQARIPGMVGMLRDGVRNAQLVTTTSEPLRELVVEGYRARGEVVAMPSTVDKSVFYVKDRPGCRRALGLPEHARLVGTAGGLHKDKGVDALYAAWPEIARRHPDAHLVLAGPFDATYPPLGGERVHYLGMLPHAQTAELFNALDLGVIYLRDTVFGRYCFPQKAYEMMACGLPLVSAAVGVMPRLLADAPQSLYEPDNPAELCAAVDAQLANPAIAGTDIDDWATLVGRMELRLRSVVTAQA